MRYNDHTLLLMNGHWWVKAKWNRKFGKEVITSTNIKVGEGNHFRRKYIMDPPIWKIVDDLCGSPDNVIVKIQDSDIYINRTWYGLEKSRIETTKRHMHIDGIRFKLDEVLITVIDLTRS